MKSFKRIYIEITNCCNLSCSFCPPSIRPQAFMDLEAFETVLERIKGHGSYVYLHIKGEPMMHPDFLEILDLCKTYNLKVNLTTNGTLMAKYAKELIDSQALRQVSISLQSQENLDDSTNILQYMSDVLEVVKEGSRLSETIFELRLWNYDTVGEMASDHKNHMMLTMIEKELSVTRETIDAIPNGKGVKLKNQVYLSKSQVFQWPSMALDELTCEGTCYGLRQQVGILVNGDVVPCCLDGEGVVRLGNIFEESFESIVTSKRASDIVEGFENKQLVEPLCRRCGYRTRFK